MYKVWLHNDRLGLSLLMIMQLLTGQNIVHSNQDFFVTIRRQRHDKVNRKHTRKISGVLNERGKKTARTL